MGIFSVSLISTVISHGNSTCTLYCIYALSSRTNRPRASRSRPCASRFTVLQAVYRLQCLFTALEVIRSEKNVNASGTALRRTENFVSRRATRGFTHTFSFFDSHRASQQWSSTIDALQATLCYRHYDRLERPGYLSEPGRGLKCRPARFGRRLDAKRP